MSTRRPIVSWAATAVAAIVACALPASAVSATTVPPTTTPAATNSSAQTDTPTDPAANPQIVESWTLSPAVPAETPNASNRPNLSYSLDPGAKVDDAVTVYNFGNVVETFKIYATDAFNDDQGNLTALKTEETPVDVGTWVTLAQDSATVQPGQQITIPVTIKVPIDATPGDHIGVIMASSPTIGTGDAGRVITLDRRTGTNLIVRVNGELTTDLAITNLETTYHHAVNSFSGSATVTFRVENRGNIRMAATPSVAVGGPFGLLGSSVTLPDIPQLLPGERVDLTAELTGVPALVLNSTEVKLVPIGTAGAATVTSSDTTFAPPLALLLVLLAVVLLVLALRARRRRTAPSKIDAPAKSDSEPELAHR